MTTKNELTAYHMQEAVNSYFKDRPQLLRTREIECFIEAGMKAGFELGRKAQWGSVEWLAVAVKAAYQEGHEDGYHTYTDMDWEKSSTKRKLDELLASSPEPPGE